MVNAGNYKCFEKYTFLKTILNIYDLKAYFTIVMLQSFTFFLLNKFALNYEFEYDSRIPPPKSIFLKNVSMSEIWHKKILS